MSKKQLVLFAMSLGFYFLWTPISSFGSHQNASPNLFAHQKPTVNIQLGHDEGPSEITTTWIEPEQIPKPSTLKSTSPTTPSNQQTVKPQQPTRKKINRSKPKKGAGRVIEPFNLVSFVLGIVSALFPHFTIALLAISFGIVGLRLLRFQKQERKRDRKFGKWGIVLGIVGIALTFIPQFSFFSMGWRVFRLF